MKSCIALIYCCKKHLFPTKHINNNLYRTTQLIKSTFIDIYQLL